MVAPIRLGGVPNASARQLLIIGDAAGFVDPLTGGYVCVCVCVCVCEYEYERYVGVVLLFDPWIRNHVCFVVSFVISFTQLLFAFKHTHAHKYVLVRVFVCRGGNSHGHDFWQDSGGGSARDAVHSRSLTRRLSSLW